MVSQAANPPAGRLLGIVLVGICLISMAALNRQSSPYDSTHTGGYHQGGGGGSVTLPFNPFPFDGAATSDRWSGGFDPTNPGRGYPPGFHPNVNHWVPPYRSPAYGNPSPFGTPYQTGPWAPDARTGEPGR